jgi:hypothetical protein
MKLFVPVDHIMRNKRCFGHMFRFGPELELEIRELRPSLYFV